MKNLPSRKMDQEQGRSGNRLEEPEYQGHYKEMNVFR